MKEEIRSLDVEVKKPESNIAKEALKEAKKVYEEVLKDTMTIEYAGALSRMYHYKELADAEEDKKGTHNTRYKEMKKRLGITPEQEKAYF